MGALESFVFVLTVIFLIACAIFGWVLGRRANRKRRNGSGHTRKDTDDFMS